MEYNKTSSYLFDDIITSCKIIFLRQRMLIHDNDWRFGLKYAVTSQGSIYSIGGTIIKLHNICGELFFEKNKFYYYVKDIIAWLFIDSKLYGDYTSYKISQNFTHRMRISSNRKRIKYKGKVKHKDKNHLNCSADNLYILL